jgi:hypothetical protein
LRRGRTSRSGSAIRWMNDVGGDGATDLPVGQFSLIDFAKCLRLLGLKIVRKRLRAKATLLVLSNRLRDPCRPAQILIAEIRKMCISGAVPFPIRGALRDRHERWKREAMDAICRKTCDTTRTAKACGLGPPGLVLSRETVLAAVTKGHGHRGERAACRGNADVRPIPRDAASRLLGMRTSFAALTPHGEEARSAVSNHEAPTGART